jgi:cysteine desulfurase/selenocysteine lyase
MVALMLQLKKGENVVLNDLDFTANIYPWLRLTKVGVNVRMARSKNGILPVNEIERHVDDKTRVITATHVTTDSGFRNDLKALAKLAHAHGAYVVADGASSTGVIPVDLNDIDVDFFAASSQKWLLGPAGSGFLYVNSRLIDELEPVLPGWYGTKSLGNIDALAWENIEFSHGSAAKFEVGTPSLLSNVGVSAGMRMLLDVGLTNVHRRVSDLTQYALEKLRAIGLNVITPADREKRAGDIVVRMKPGNVALTVQRALESKRIMTEALDESEHQLRLGWKGGCLRFSPCFFNTEKEVDTLTEALHSIM